MYRSDESLLVRMSTIFERFVDDDMQRYRNCPDIDSHSFAVEGSLSRSMHSHRYLQQGPSHLRQD